MLSLYPEEQTEDGKAVYIDDDGDDSDDDNHTNINVPLTVTVAVIGGYIFLGALLYGFWEEWDMLDVSIVEQKVDMDNILEYIKEYASEHSRNNFTVIPHTIT